MCTTCIDCAIYRLMAKKTNGQKKQPLSQSLTLKYIYLRVKQTNVVTLYGITHQLQQFLFQPLTCRHYLYKLLTKLFSIQQEQPISEVYKLWTCYNCPASR